MGEWRIGEWIMGEWSWESEDGSITVVCMSSTGNYLYNHLELEPRDSDSPPTNLRYGPTYWERQSVRFVIAVVKFGRAGSRGK